MSHAATEPMVVGRLSGGEGAWWVLSIFALAGPLVLGLGYANMGVRIAGFPIPITDVLLVVLLARALAPVAAGKDPMVGLPHLCALGLAAIGVARFAFDYADHGVFAARDVVLPVELTFLFVGTWAMGRYGLERWTLALTLIFLAAQAYLVIGRVWDLSAFGPMGGFTQPRALLYPSWGQDTAATAGFFFFLWVRPLRRWSVVVAAAFAALAFLSQKRGIYVALPLATLITVVIGWRGLDRSARRYVLVTSAVFVVLVALLLALAPSGRFGRFTPSLVFDQLRTLVGAEGTGSGTISHRAEWAQGIFEQMNARPSAYIVGLGLGPDLLEGFVDLAGLPVRKPHNDYLEVMARLGIPALVLMAGALLVPLVVGARAARTRDGPERDYLLFVTGSSIVILFIAATQPILSYPFGTISLGFYLGSGWALARGGRRSISDRGRVIEDPTGAISAPR